MTAKINTRQYYYLYNTRPQGVKNWRFAIGPHEVTYYYTGYRAACQQARAEAERLKATTIYLLYLKS